MADKDKFVNIADLKAKLRYWCRARGMTSAAQDSLMETIKRIPYTVKADIESTLETTETLSEDYEHGFKDGLKVDSVGCKSIDGKERSEGK